MAVVCAPCTGDQQVIWPPDDIAQLCTRCVSRWCAPVTSSQQHHRVVAVVLLDGTPAARRAWIRQNLPPRLRWFAPHVRDLLNVFDREHVCVRERVPAPLDDLNIVGDTIRHLTQLPTQRGTALKVPSVLPSKMID